MPAGHRPGPTLKWKVVGLYANQPTETESMVDLTTASAERPRFLVSGVNCMAKRPLGCNPYLHTILHTLIGEETQLRGSGVGVWQGCPQHDICLASPGL